MRTISLFPLDLGGIRFRQTPLSAFGSDGTRYTRWVPYGMPQLGQYKWIMDTVFFLYPTEKDAKAGTEYGGTGFFVAVPSKRWPNDYFHIHGVSNWHVVCKHGSSVLRINRKNGGSPATFQYDPSEWAFKPGGPDIAISPPLDIDPENHKAAAINFNDFLLQEDERAADISAAEDIFMIGRFVDYDGVETNEPSFRFGNISIMDAKVLQPTGFAGRSIVADMHSRTGYSGSPVFIYRTPGSVLAPMIDLAITWHYIRLIGALWGQFPEDWELKEKEKYNVTGSSAQASLITDGKYVEGLSGMCCVVPSQDILGVLGCDELRKKREEIELRIAGDMPPRSLRPLPMNASQPPGGKSIQQQLEEKMERIAMMTAMVMG